MRDEQKKKVRALETEYDDSIEDAWQAHIGAYIRFKDAQLINYEYLNPKHFGKWKDEAHYNCLTENPIYVHAVLMKPGKHYYLIRDWNQNDYLYKTIGNLRECSMPHMTKMLVSNEIERIFNLESSVFKLWRADTKKGLDSCLDNDSLSMRLGKVIKDDSEKESLMKMVR